MRPMVTFTQDAATNGTQESEWLQCDSWCPGPVSVQVNVYNAPGASIVYTVFSTMDDPNDPASPVPPQYVSWFQCGDTNLVNSSFPAQTYYQAAPRYIKLVQTGGTGIAQLTVSQNGSAPY